jgi:hypothetical protein
LRRGRVVRRACVHLTLNRDRFAGLTSGDALHTAGFVIKLRHCESDYEGRLRWLRAGRFGFRDARPSQTP